MSKIHLHFPTRRCFQDGHYGSIDSVKACFCHPDLRCYHRSCSFLDGMGNVVVCRLVPNPDGRFTVRRVGLQLHGIFDKNALRHNGGCR